MDKSIYDTEHNVQDAAPAPGRRQRPDLSTFFASLEHVDTSNVSNPHSQPIPGQVAATFSLALEAMRQLMADNDDADLRDQIEGFLSAQADIPPKEVRGVSDAFLADLERVPRKQLKKSDECPICAQPFLSDEYALVVRLPCNRSHMFDLECIQPWLKVNPTCPLDRKEFEEKKAPPPPAKDDDDEEDYDDMYA